MVSNHACIAKRRGTDKNIPAIVSFIKLLLKPGGSGEWKRTSKSGKKMLKRIACFTCSEAFFQKNLVIFTTSSTHCKKNPTTHLWSPKCIQRRRDPAKPPRCESPGTESHKNKNECLFGKGTWKKSNLKKEAELLVVLAHVVGTAPWNLHVFAVPRSKSYASCSYDMKLMLRDVRVGGGVMLTFFALAHMWHATQVMGWWGGVGWGGDVNVPCTCTHVTCYASDGLVGWGGDVNVPCTCTHVTCYASRCWFTKKKRVKNACTGI